MSVDEKPENPLALTIAAALSCIAMDNDVSYTVVLAVCSIIGKFLGVEIQKIDELFNKGVRQFIAENEGKIKVLSSASKHYH